MTTRQQQNSSHCHRCISATMRCTLFLCAVLWSCLTPVYTRVTCCPKECRPYEVHEPCSDGIKKEFYCPNNKKTESCTVGFDDCVCNTGEYRRKDGLCVQYRYCEGLDGYLEDFLPKNQRLHLVGMSDVDLGSPARCMHAEFKWGSTDVAEADLFYEEADQNNGGSWTSKTATLKFTKELIGQHVDIIVNGSPRLTFEFFYAKNECLIMGTSLPPTGEKTNCLIWSTQTDFKKLKKECVFVAEEFCVKPSQFTSSLQECPRW
ncbi:uncharacterized protein LOC142767581 isoform X1 [Rhipicephalus microplus]|uniref:uncharacterized protein LOC142767581 isoform X1 n=1 Tax=Rhipicephalus microplus TaxID=6941 RepID=UPI003F6AC61A